MVVAENMHIKEPEEEEILSEPYDPDDNTLFDNLYIPEFSSYNSTLDLTDEQKEAWLWDDYISKRVSFPNAPIW